jgi:hypothetical protein
MQKGKAIPFKEEDITLIRINKRIREALPVAVGQTVGGRKKSF